MKILLALACLLWATSAQAAPDWSEGFEYASSAAMDAVWITSCPGSVNNLDINTDLTRVHSGSKSLKMIYRGHQGITPGYTSCSKDRYFTTGSATIYTRWWVFIESNFAIDLTSTKVTKQTHNNLYPSFWWVFKFGSHNLSVSMEGRMLANGTHTTTDVTGGTIPFGQWNCVETQITLNSPGVADGIVRQWVNNILTLDLQNQLLRGTGTGPTPPYSDATVLMFAKIYAQDGVGTMYLDDYVVDRTARIGGCPFLVTDTTPPTMPTNFTVSP